jgi:tetratricopeptide (TPR) repeat protein
MLLFTCFARILLEHFEERRAPLWLLPLLMLLWVNLHTGFVAGLALIAAYLFVEALETPFPARRAAALLRVRRAVPWFIATVAVTILNPWGIRIFVAVSRQQAVTRWQSAFLEEWAPIQGAVALQNLGWRDPDSACWWLLGLGIVVAVACLWRRHIGAALVILTAAFVFIRHSRMEGPCIVLVCLIGGSVLSKAATLPGLRRFEKNCAAAVVSLLAILVAVRSFDLVTNRTYLSSGAITLFGAGPSWWLPQKATDFLLQQHLPANVFSSFNLSSYLVWRLGAQYPDFADGRYVPFGERLFDEQRMLTALPLDSEEWTRAADAYGIHTVIFPLSRIFALGEFPLLADCESKHWTPVYMDTSAIIFQRNDFQSNDSQRHDSQQNDSQPQTTLRPSAIDCQTLNLLPPAELYATNSGGRAERYRIRAEQYQIFANASGIYSLLGRFNEAQEAADLAANLAANTGSGDPTLYFIRAQTALGLQQYELSEKELRTALNIRRTDAGWYNLGLLYIRERRLPEAVDALEKSAHLSREGYQRHLLIARVLLAEQQPQLALQALAQAARESPYAGSTTSEAAEFTAELSEQQALVYMEFLQPEKAVELQLRAVRQTPENEQRRRVLAQDCQAAKMACPVP